MGTAKNMSGQHFRGCEGWAGAWTTYQGLPMLGLHRFCDFAHCEEDSGRAARHRIGSPSTTFGFGASSTALLVCQGASSAGPLLEAGGEVGRRCDLEPSPREGYLAPRASTSLQTDAELQQRPQRCQTAPSAWLWYPSCCITVQRVHRIGSGS